MFLPILLGLPHEAPHIFVDFQRCQNSVGYYLHHQRRCAGLTELWLRDCCFAITAVISAVGIFIYHKISKTCRPEASDTDDQ